MEPFKLTENDVCLHVVKFGLDVYPPVEIPNERTRLNMFYEAARERWPMLFGRLVASDTEFKTSKGFRKNPEVEGPAAYVDTCVLTNRGPVFIFPILLPGPVGETGLGETHLEQFKPLRDLFFQALPDRKILRLGLIRELLLSTGQAPCVDSLSAQSSFAGAELTGGSCLFHYRDAKCNVRIHLAPGEIMTTTQLPVGQQVEQREGYGLQVRLDVNNTEIRPLEDADIEEIVARATGLWPEELLAFLNGRSPS